MRRVSLAFVIGLLLTTAATAQQKREPVGTLTIGLSSIGTAEQWLPWLESGREGWLGLEPVYESLVGSEPKTGKFAPQLAERWEVEDGAKRWRFFLRKGVKFHDGSEMTSADVVFSHEQMVGQKSVASAGPVLRGLVGKIEAVGPHEVVYHLKQPDVTFLGRVGTTLFGVVSKAYVERVGEKEAATKPIGTGPFRMVEHKRQQSITYEAVPHYADTPGFKTVVLRRVPDQSARLAMLRSREIDITEIPFKLKRETDAAGLKIFRVPGAAVYHVQLGGQLSPKREQFDKSVPWVAADPKDSASVERARKVRLAMNLAVDKTAIIRAIFEGEGQPSISPFFPPGSEFLEPGMKALAYDPKEAKRLLAEAGYPNGFGKEIEMLLMPWPGRAEMADVGEVVAGFWEKNLGVKVRRRPMDWATFAPNYGASRKMPWVTWAHGFNPRVFPDPINGMDSWLMTSSRYNSVGEYPEIDDLASKVRGEVDDKKRLDLYRQMAKLFVANHYAVTIASVPALYAYNDKRIASWELPRGEAYISGYHRAMPAK